MRNKFFFILIFVLSFWLTNALAQTSTQTKSISGGVLNGKAASLPKPSYPAAARAVRASGAVNVQVTIDEEGNVISASAVSGHPLLQQVSVQAALASRFNPTILSGQVVKVTGVIVYNFIPPSALVEKTEWLRRASFLATVSNGDWNSLSENLLLDFTKVLTGEFETERLKLLTITDFPEKRAEIINGVFSSLEKKLSEPEVWQVELGKAMAGVAVEVQRKIGDANYNFNEERIRKGLSRIRELSYSAPAEIPAELVEALKPLSDKADKAELKSPEALIETIQSLRFVMKTISSKKDS